MATATPKKNEKTVAVPYVGGEFLGYVSRTPEVELTHEQAVTLQHVYEGLSARGVKLNRVGETVGWILDQVKNAKPE